MQWLDFTKLVGITIQGKGIIDGRGSVWWQDRPFDNPIADEEKLIVPLNNSVKRPPMPVKIIALDLQVVQSNSNILCREANRPHFYKLYFQVQSELGGKMPFVKPTVRAIL